ncbi:FAD-dependent monooxygenase [Aliidiomarina sanyensis]|uniref:FAD-dependent monooxygenase n=1 Tax=Aliidiomarina sanyensis TaxID=1249555 RepID=UPI00130093F2|nr:FAD-dependent monooxygenase [Aliidiomarina sanyensis]
MERADVVIAGGGLTGCLAAIVFSRRFPAHRIVLLDQFSNGSHQDPRGLALALRTQQILTEFGVWQEALTHSAAIAHIHVSDATGPGTMTMHAEREGLPALGYVAMAGTLQQELDRALEGILSDRVQRLRGTQISSLKAEADGYQLTLSSSDKNVPQTIHAGLLVVAEGSQSKTRDLLGINMESHPYAQVALAGIVEYADGHHQWAYERFTDHGPVALLPQGKKQAALVWCTSEQEAQRIQALSADDQLRALQHKVGAAPGRLQSVQLQGVFPLQLALAERFIGHRSVLIGNACHTLHPVAGQGYNLGVRDIIDLVHHLDPNDLGGIDGLQHYRAQRLSDYQEIVGLTHGLVHVFSNQNPILRQARSKGLYTLRICDALSRPLMRKAMGFRALIG